LYEQCQQQSQQGSGVECAVALIKIEKTQQNKYM